MVQFRFMLEEKSDFDRFLSENEQGDWFVDAIPIDDGVHPASSQISILFIKNILTGKTYHYCFDHPDAPRAWCPGTWFCEKYLSNRINRMWALDKKYFTQLLNLPNVHDANLVGFLRNNAILELLDFETPVHNFVRRRAEGYGKVNKIIPLLKHKEMFEDMADSVMKMVKDFSPDRPYFSFNDKIIGTLGKLEKNGIFVDPELFEKFFKTKPNKNGLVFSQYNVYTSTGRPSNRFGGVNYAAMNHTDGCRGSIVSRYGADGRMIMIDYTAFHPRIICMLIDYRIPDDVNIYEYLAKLYFQKQNPDEEDIIEAKKITFRQLYGGVEEKYHHIKYLASLKTYINEKWDFFQKNGYVETPIFGRHITEKHIESPNPTKLFNYILQAVEGEIAIPIIQKIQDEILKDKQTKPVLYTYDSVLYDFHRADGRSTLNQIKEAMGYYGKFSLKMYAGSSYHDLRLVSS